MRFQTLFFITALAAAVLSTACEEKHPASGTMAPVPPPPPPPSGAETATSTVASTARPSDKLPVFDPSNLAPFQPIPEGVDKPVIDDVVKLGQKLYADARLSRGADVSCASCHDLAKAGADDVALSTGSQKQKPKHNTPTVLNAGGSFAQGWDARTSTIEEYVVPHVCDASIMGMTDDKHVVAALTAIPAYATAFQKAFPDDKPAISPDTIGRALGGYVKKLFARSRWDRYLAGDTTALTPAELTGVAMFVEAGCPTCHQGKYVGATQSQKLGVAKPWPPPAGADPGRFELTKQEADRGMFKVPTLRNVTRTGPYLHDGSIAKLEDVVHLMERHQVGRELSDVQVSAIVAFLGALTGDPPKELVAKPSPAGGPKAPKAE